MMFPPLSDGGENESGKEDVDGRCVKHGRVKHGNRVRLSFMCEAFTPQNRGNSRPRVRNRALVSDPVILYPVSVFASPDRFEQKVRKYF